MKKILLFLALICSMGAFAQTQRYYCEVNGIVKELSSALKIGFDFGRNPVYPAWERLKGEPRIVDENGYEIKDMIDAGNYLSSKGWTLQQAYFSAILRVYHWVFYKDAESPEKAVEGIMTVDEYNEMKKQRQKANTGKE